MKLRDYQAITVNKIRSAYQSGAKRVCLTMPTGAGKTVVFTYIANKMNEVGKSVLILAHRIELIEQISDTLKKFRVPHGTITAGQKVTRDRIQVGMVLTVVNKAEQLRPDFIICDECHRSTSKSYTNVFKKFPGTPLLGVTATPARTDGTGLKEVYQKLVIGPTTRDLIEAGHLSPYRLFCPPTKMDLSRIKKTAGDYNKGHLAMEVDRPQITGDAVEHYKKNCPGVQFVAFCTGREHAKNAAETFRSAGISCRNIDGTMSKSERRQIISDLRNNLLKGVTSCDLISEGFDLPAITAGIMLRPTCSLIVHLQQIGRILRPEPGKTAIILDHSANVLRHGLPDAYRDWTLDGVKKAIREDKVRVRTCQKCFAVYQGHLRQCPMCKAEAETKSRMYETMNGELLEVSPLQQQEERFRAMPYKEALAHCWTPGDILLMARARGYRPGWAIRQVMKLENCNKWQAAELIGYERGYATHVDA